MQKSQDIERALFLQREPEQGKTGLYWDVLKRFMQHKLAVSGGLALFALIVISVFAPVLAPHDPYESDRTVWPRSNPSPAHLLGTDDISRDVLSRLLYGGRVSLSVGLVSVSISLVVGIIMGTISGYYGQGVDNLIMRITELFMTFPSLMLIMTVVAIVGPSIYNVMIVIGLTSWPRVARLVRGSFLSLREQDFVVAARALGAGHSRIIYRHLLPNVVSSLVVAATFGVAGSILTEAALSYLGLGVQQPIASWGSMLKEGQSLSVLESKPWLWVPPGLMISIAVLSINFIGDGLRDAFDPHMIIGVKQN